MSSCAIALKFRMASRQIQSKLFCWKVESKYKFSLSYAWWEHKLWWLFRFRFLFEVLLSLLLWAAQLTVVIIFGIAFSRCAKFIQQLIQNNKISQKYFLIPSPWFLSLQYSIYLQYTHINCLTNRQLTKQQTMLRFKGKEAVLLTAPRCIQRLWCVCLHYLVSCLLRYHTCWSHQGTLLYQTQFWSHSCSNYFPD